MKKVFGNGKQDNTIKQNISKIRRILKQLAESPAMLELHNSLKLNPLSLPSTKPIIA